LAPFHGHQISHILRTAIQEDPLQVRLGAEDGRYQGLLSFSEMTRKKKAFMNSLLGFPRQWMDICRQSSSHPGATLGAC
jgi:hypothetical protein